MNRILILILLLGLLFAIYKYQDTILSQLPTMPAFMSDQDSESLKLLTNNSNASKPKLVKFRDNDESKTKNKKNKKNITIDNISQASLGSLLEDDDNSVLRTESKSDGTENSQNSNISKSSLFF